MDSKQNTATRMKGFNFIRKYWKKIGWNDDYKFYFCVKYLKNDAYKNNIFDKSNLKVTLVS